MTRFPTRNGRRGATSMPLMTVKQYKDSLRDGRTVYYRGAGSRTSRHTRSSDRGRACGHRSTAWPTTTREPARRRRWTGRPRIPATIRFPAARMTSSAGAELIERATTLGGTLVVLIKKSGATRSSHCTCSPRIWTRRRARAISAGRALLRACRDNDLAVAVAQTDVKGDRAKGPSEQTHPDYYVHVTARGRRGYHLARGQGPHVGVDERPRDHRATDTQHVRGRRGVRGGVRGAGERARSDDARQRLWTAGQRVRAADQRASQDDGDADSVRGREGAVGPRVPQRRGRHGRPAREDLRRVPPVHRCELQAALGRPLRRRIALDGGGTTGSCGPGTCGTSSPSSSATRRSAVG